MAVRAPLEIPSEDGPERDRALIQAHVDGNRDAFQMLVFGHYQSMLGHAYRRLHDGAAAEDAVQDALVRAYRSLGEQHCDYRLGPWLHRILENVCTDEGRRRQREVDAARRFHADLTVLRPVPDESPDLEHVTAAIAALPQGYREALVMRDVMELEYADMAQHAGITEQNARARVSRARAALRKLVAATVTVWVVLGRLVRRGSVATPKFIRTAYASASTLPQDAVLAPQRSISAVSTIALTAVAMASVAAPALVSSPQAPTTNPGERSATPLKSTPQEGNQTEIASAPSLGSSAYVEAPLPVITQVKTTAVAESTTTTVTKSSVSAVPAPKVAPVVPPSAPAPAAQPPADQPAHPSWTGASVPAPAGPAIPESDITAPSLTVVPGAKSDSVSGSAAVGLQSSGGSGPYSGSMANPKSRCGSAVDGTLEMTLGGSPTTVRVVGELTSVWNDTHGGEWAFVGQVTATGSKDYTGSGWIKGTIRTQADGSRQLAAHIWGPGTADAPAGPGSCSTPSPSSGPTPTSTTPTSTTSTTAPKTSSANSAPAKPAAA
ncbi:MAG: hypothetical protein NVSMB16_09200 [Acidimicrobiales bacterium]